MRAILGDSRITLQPFVVNGFDDDLHVNEPPPFGLIAAWEPTQSLRLAVTHMYGPEMDGDTANKQYMLLVEGEWFVTNATTLRTQLLYGMTESPTGRKHWHVAAEVAVRDRRPIDAVAEQVQSPIDLIRVIESYDPAAKVRSTKSEIQNEIQTPSANSAS